MELLEKKILESGQVLDGDVLKVGNFLNHNVDVKLLDELANEVYKHYNNISVDKVLTVEASGIAFATLVAVKFGVDMVFAKKSKSSNVVGECYQAECYSYTHKNTNVLQVPKDYIKENSKVLIVDDFLAMGGASQALIDICKQANASVVGFTSLVEKGFQGGGDKMRKSGIDVFSLAVIDSMENGIVFRK